MDNGSLVFKGFFSMYKSLKLKSKFYFRKRLKMFGEL